MLAECSRPKTLPVDIFDDDYSPQIYKCTETVQMQGVHILQQISEKLNKVNV